MRAATASMSGCPRCRRDEGVDILIDDDGPGVPESERERVFRPFIRLDASRNQATGGVGLGLTIARDMARSHGGDVRLETSPFGGLRARVHLPIAAATNTFRRRNAADEASGVTRRLAVDLSSPSPP